MLKENPQKLIIRVITLVLVCMPLTLTLTACNKKPSGLTEESLRKFYDIGLQAVAKRDAQGTCARYADSAEIRIIKFTQLRSEKKTQSKAELCRELESVYTQLNAMHMTTGMQLDISAITIAADGKSADVISTVTETIQFAGQGAAGTSQQADHIEWIDGKPLITQTTVRMTGAT